SRRRSRAESGKVARFESSRICLDGSASASSRQNYLKIHPIQPTLSLQLSLAQKAIELSRPWVLLVLYLITAGKGWWPLAVPIAFATCLAAFIQMHDAMHRSLGLSKRAHDFVLL